MVSTNQKINNRKVIPVLIKVSQKQTTLLQVQVLKLLEIQVLKQQQSIGCFKGTLSVKVKDNAKPYQMPLRHIAYALQEPFRKELERLQEQQIIAPLGVDKMVEWCNTS